MAVAGIAGGHEYEHQNEAIQECKSVVLFDGTQFNNHAPPPGLQSSLPRRAAFGARLFCAVCVRAWQGEEGNMMPDGTPLTAQYSFLEIFTAYRTRCDAMFDALEVEMR
jgi:hypothetical protein